MDRKFLEHWLKENGKTFEEISDTIWNLAETRYHEYRSADLQKTYMKEHGFNLQEAVAGIETAFIAEYGSGYPVIAVLGEFDALPGLSQEADCAEKTPCKTSANKDGHGCGHNLLGAAAMEAVCAVRHYMIENNLKGTLRYYGCPAEESGAGKAFMVREGCFEDVDICLAWHPGNENGLSNTSLANTRIIFHFDGISAHAAANPHLGRSALDAVELMNVGANYLREHIIPEARMHYAVTNTGGDAPNIVQAEAEVLYAIRAPKINDVKAICERVSDVARGAALMTGTKVDIRVVSAYADFVSSDVLDELFLQAEKEIDFTDYTQEELEYAERFAKVGPAKQNKEVIMTGINCDKKKKAFNSTDVGDVSQVVPCSSARICCYASGTTMHTWMAVAQGKSSIAHKGMHRAANVLAASAIRLLEDTSLVDAAKKEFEQKFAGKTYTTMIPEDVKPGSF